MGDISAILMVHWRVEQSDDLLDIYLVSLMVALRVSLTAEEKVVGLVDC